MLKTCSVCGRIHSMSKDCSSERRKRYSNKYNTNDVASNFRRTNKWKVKSETIRKRDKYLCQICQEDLYNTTYRYNYKKLEVHHIVPLREDASLGLDGNNLITLCSYHHKMADNNEISRELLTAIVQKDEETIKKIKEKIGEDAPYR